MARGNIKGGCYKILRWRLPRPDISGLAKTTSDIHYVERSRDISKETVAFYQEIPSTSRRMEEVAKFNALNTSLNWGQDEIYMQVANLY